MNESSLSTIQTVHALHDSSVSIWRRSFCQKLSMYHDSPKIDPYTGARTRWFTQDHPQQAWQAREALLKAHYLGTIGSTIRNPNIAAALQACPQKHFNYFSNCCNLNCVYRSAAKRVNAGSSSVFTNFIASPISGCV